MKQWGLLGLVVFMFLLVWGTVIYQLFNKQDSYNGLTHAVVNEVIAQKPQMTKLEPIATKKENLNVIIRKQTEINKGVEPPISEGIDFGDGISIDDLLQNLGIVMNN